MVKAALIDKKDNVAVVLDSVKKGEEVCWSEDGESKSVRALGDLPCYHKIAVRHIAANEPVVKYGEHIGIAVTDIPTGSHVHVHNVRDNREVL